MVKPSAWIILPLLAFPLTVGGPSAQEGGLKVYIGADMEGLVGTVTITEVVGGEEGPRYPAGKDYDMFRRILTDQVNAAIKAAFEAGATEVLVNESHGGMQFRNLLLDRLDPRVKVARGWPRPHVMSTGLDGTFDAMLFIGYHARAGSDGVMAHTYAFEDLLINGIRMGEGEFNALYGGMMGVPLVLISGDDVVVRQVEEQVGDIEDVVVKKALGRNAAITMMPDRAAALLSQATTRAIKNLDRYRPYRLKPPFKTELILREQFEKYAEEVAALPGYDLSRTGPRSFSLVTDSVGPISELFNDIEALVFPGE